MSDTLMLNTVEAALKATAAAFQMVPTMVHEPMAYITRAMLNHALGEDSGPKPCCISADAIRSDVKEGGMYFVDPNHADELKYHLVSIDLLVDSEVDKDVIAKYGCKLERWTSEPIVLDNDLPRLDSANRLSSELEGKLYDLILKLLEWLKKKYLDKPEGTVVMTEPTVSVYQGADPPLSTNIVLTAWAGIMPTS